MNKDNLDNKLIQFFNGKVVRKDLVHQIKAGTNVPTFVLEFLLARYCASDDPSEIAEGLEAVISTLQDNYVRPDESNAAQSKVATQGKHRFIDKIHVTYKEKEKRHWAALENFNSQTIAISEKLYKDNDRLLEGGIWAEVTVAYNEVEEDKYAFIIDSMRPIQLSRFDFDFYTDCRKQFTRDEWLDVILRSVGLEPNALTKRQKFHYITRLAPLVEPNYNYIELGPRGTGKSYFFSEFTPYSTLLSQASKSVLFYNTARKHIGMVGFWDTIAFDEVANIKLDTDTSDIMKNYMANGRFSRGVEVIADASFVFVGNIDYSIKQIVDSFNHDLFVSLPKEFDLAILDRFAYYLPGWEMPKTDSKYMTNNYGLITDYLAEGFHYLFSHTNRYEEVNKRAKLGHTIEGRDEKGVKKTICAFLKILHPDGAPTDEEFDEYVEYALEGRRRVKEQMNKRKADEEYAHIDLSYINRNNEEIIVYCPETKDSPATLKPVRSNKLPDDVTESRDGKRKKKKVNSLPLEVIEPKIKPEETKTADNTTIEGKPLAELFANTVVSMPELKEKHYTIKYGETGHSYETILDNYLIGANEVIVEDPYIRLPHQIQNFIRFCEAALKHSSISKITLVTSFDDEAEMDDINEKFEELKQSLLEIDIILSVEFNQNMHDRDIIFDNGWHIKIGRGLDIFQKPSTWYCIGASDVSYRPCLETKVDIFRS